MYNSSGDVYIRTFFISISQCLTALTNKGALVYPVFGIELNKGKVLMKVLTCSMQNRDDRITE